MKMTKMCAKNMDLTETEWWTVLFTLTFSCLRISAGGCHLKTSLGCTCMTTLLMIGGTEIALSVDLSLAVENILFVLGIAATISPITFIMENVIDIVILVVMSVLVWAFAWTKKKLDRFEGIVMLALYAVYLVYICMR